MKAWKNLIAVAITMAAWTIAGTAYAADMGGAPCGCSDLEERVAELEATTARKDNRKVTLTIYGQISKSLMWVDGDSRTGVDNFNAPTLFGLKGSARISKDFTTGYVIEYEAGDVPVVRHSYAWLDTPYGKVSLGRTSMATHEIGDISLANTAVVVRPGILFGSLIEGERRNLVRYDTPTIAGFVASVAWSNADNWDMAVRYTGEFSGVRLAAGFGYSENEGFTVFPQFAMNGIGRRLSGSASAMHVESGIFLNGAYGRTFDYEGDVWSVMGGLERSFVEFGKTTLFLEVGRFDTPVQAYDGWGLGVVQNIAISGMDLYGSYRKLDETDILMMGTRIKF